jgi:DNA polymerase III epsilon subunit family exonuclease
VLNVVSGAWVSAAGTRFSQGGLDDVPFVAFDTETTGLGASARLVELGAVRFRGEHLEDEWSCLVDPGVPIPPEATAIHGISDQDVAGRPRAREVLGGFLHFIEGAALVAHHAPFDVGILSRELLRAGLALPDNPVLDTCAIPRRLRLDVPNHRLGTLAGAFRVPCGRAHRALADARVAAGLLCAYLKRLGPAAEALVRDCLTHEGLASSLRRSAAETLPRTPLLALLRRARIEQRPVWIVYRGGTRGLRPRRVRPRDLYGLGGRCYLEAECLETTMVKTFRTDRIAAARLD